jgi:ElaB/YqjD/DUF883 family membrane-anchored ribosome-binding protein
MNESETSVERSGEQRDPEQIRRDIEQTREELGDSVEALAAKADVKAQAKRQVEDRKEALRAQQQRAQQKFTEVRERVSGATPEDAKGAMTRAATTAQERPGPAIGVAFAAGAFLGWLVGRR